MLAVCTGAGGAVYRGTADSEGSTVDADIWEAWARWGIVLGILLLVVAAIAIAALLVLRLIGRHKSWPNLLMERMRWPFRVILVLIALIGSTTVLPVDEGMHSLISQALTIAVIGVGAWLLCQLFLFFVDSGSAHYKLASSDTFSAAKIRTQLQIVRRLVVAIITVLAVGAILMTFDGVRAVGASVLASAGIASVVAGLAAQSVLGNLFAGVQIAFSEAIRVGDVVVVEGEFGTINEITLSYVVLQLWDQRTLVLPCTYFTTTPFENWTKLGRALMGTVYFDLDWRVPVDGMRAELDRLLAEEAGELWDGESAGVQVTDASGGRLTVRVVVSARDSGALWDLRCLIREKLAAWVRSEAPEGLLMHRLHLDAPLQDAAELEAGDVAPRAAVGAGSAPEEQAQQA